MYFKLNGHTGCVDDLSAPSTAPAARKDRVASLDGRCYMVDGRCPLLLLH